MAHNGYTPTQQRMLTVLADGKSHAREELVACLNDELSNLNVMMYTLRCRLRPIGQDVACELVNGATYYRQVRVVTTNDR